LSDDEVRPDAAMEGEEESAPASQSLGMWLGILAVLALLSLVLELGFALPRWLSVCLYVLQSVVAAILIIETVWSFVTRRVDAALVVRRRVDLAVVVLLLICWFLFESILSISPSRMAIGCVRVAVLYFAVSRGMALLSAAAKTRPVSLLLSKFYANPPLAVPASFVVVILIGTLLLCLPRATATGESMNPIDALFTATSATCVTGLIVKSTPDFFSRFGQSIILILIQIGGLGIMTMSTIFLMMMGKRLLIPQQVMVKSALDTQSIAEVGKTVKAIVIFTFIMEAIGATLLFAKWFDEFPSLGDALFCSVFHSVSAFCNAGFSLFNDSLMAYRGNVLINLTMMSLIVIGGLGFAVLINVGRTVVARRRVGQWFPARTEERIAAPQGTEEPSIAPRLTLHTKLVLVTSLCLILGGAFLFSVFEAEGVLAGLSLKERIFASFFQSITARTAGFNTVDIKQLSPASSLMLIAWMFVGGSPGSTAGGIKTTTFAILLLSVFAFLRGRPDVTYGGRRISDDNQRRAIAVALIAIFVLTLFLLLLFALPTLKDGQPRGCFREMLFEVFSAFGTVGLSQGITARLNGIGKILITFLMLIGRVGPLTIAIAIGGRRPPTRIKYPEAKVMVG